MIGLVLNGDQVVWGNCLVETTSPAAGALATIQKVVAPALEGQRLEGSRQLAGMLDNLTETVADTRTTGAASKGNRRLSRRDFITGRFLARALLDEPPSPQKKVTHQQPVDPAIRDGVSLPLLEATAIAHEQTVAELIQQEYGLPSVNAPSPIQILLNSDHPSESIPALLDQVAALGHTPKLDLDEQRFMGALTNFIRSIQRAHDQLPELAGRAYQPIIHLNLGGKLGALYENDPGKILGALVRLEQAAAPYQLWIADPVLMERARAQIEVLSTLMDYVRFRKISVQMVAGSWVQSSEDVRAILDSGAAHLIHLRMPRIGTVDRAIETILACRQKEIGVLLDGNRIPSEREARHLAQIAVSTQPGMLLARAGYIAGSGGQLASLEMARTLARMGS